MFTRLCLVCIALVAFAGSAGRSENLATYENHAALDLNGTWEAHSTSLAFAWPPPADGWKSLTIPCIDQDFITSDGIGPYWPGDIHKVMTPDGLPADPAHAAAWFRRSFNFARPLPIGTRAHLCLDGVAWRSVTYLNGVRVGESVLGNVSHVYDVTTALRLGTNVLLVGATSRAGLWDQAHQTFIAPFSGVMPGIHDAVRLEVVPEIRVDDAFVRTAIATKRLEIDLELVNDSGLPARVTPHADIRDPLGQPNLTLTGLPVDLPAHGRVTTTLSADWSPLRLWSPGTPNLYTARVTLFAGNQLQDVREQTFGAREFTIRGRDFLLNGQRQVLFRNSWLCTVGTPHDTVINWVRDEIRNYNCIRLHLGFNNPHIFDAADRNGLLVMPEFWGWYHDDNTYFPITKADFWLPNTLEVLRRQIRRFRNHPAVIMWSLTNETFWDSVRPESMAIAEKICRAARQADPTRPLSGDGEVTWSNRLDVINVHYPEGDAGTVSKRYENSGWVIPNDLDWLQPTGTNHTWRGNFVWDRPLLFGEFDCSECGEPDRHSTYAGETGYDRTRWLWQDFFGRHALLPLGSPWIDMVKMSCDHYRAAGVAGLNPWTGIGAQLMPPELVAPLDHFPNLFGGESAARLFFVANDGSHNWNGMHLQAALMVNGRAVWAERNIACQLGGGESRRIPITLQPPAVNAITRARLVVRLCYQRGAEPTELDRHEEDVWIMPHASLRELNPATVALADTPNGPTTRALAALGLRTAPGPSDDAALAGKRVLIIGENAITTADLSAAARFVATGGQLVLLHQTNLPAFFPWQPELDTHHAASYSWREATHPALANLDETQLRCWRPDHLVCTETFVRPAEGAGVAAIACGGRYGMHWAPLVDVRDRQGKATFCQYRLADRINVEPVAGWILAQLVSTAANAAPEPPAPALSLAPGVSATTRAVLQACRVRLADTLDGTGPVFLDAAHPPDAATLVKLQQAVMAGRKIWLHGLTPANVATWDELLPWRPAFTPLAPEIHGAARRGESPLLAGIGNSDLLWAHGGPLDGTPTTPLGGPVLVPPALDAAEQLTDPTLLLAIPVGKGVVLIDQLAWEGTLGAETEHGTRLVSALARNLGAGFLPPTDELARFHFTGLDLAAQANRDYVDEVAGDGRGGWTDQGDNDMRYFLINHTGKVGGMPVPTPPFPSQISLRGVTYRLVNPKTNGGRAVLVFRGTGHDPAALAEVRGIPAGHTRAQRIWFLHAKNWGGDAPPGTTVARYEIVYDDGTRAVAPVRAGFEVSDWWNPQPLPNAQVAWTGRNEKTSPIGLYAMAWDNPHPEKPIASVDVIGALSNMQLMLLAITLGEESGTAGERTVAEWDCARFVNGTIAARVGNSPMRGTGTPVTLGNRAGLRLTGGQSVVGNLTAGPLAEGRPIAIEIEVAPDDLPGGYCGGLVQVGSYYTSGLRIVLGRNLCVSVEQWCGVGQTNAHYLVSHEPLTIGSFSTIRYEHDGKIARLLIDGRLQDLKPSPPPAPYHGEFNIGYAAGKDYFLNGVVGSVRFLALEPPAPVNPPGGAP